MRFLTTASFRSLRKAPGFSLSTVLTLGLAIGLNAAIFSAVYGVLLRPLALPAADRLYTISQNMEARGGAREAATSLRVFTEWRSRNRSLKGMAAYLRFSADLCGIDEPENVPGAAVSHEYFSVLGVEPVAGRAFGPEEDAMGQHLVAVLSQELWMRSFGGDPNIVGRTITVNAAQYTVVGILPAGFRAPLIPETELWTMLVLDPRPEDQEYSYVPVIGRLAGGVRRAAAQADMERVAASIAADYPKAMHDVGVTLRPLLDAMVGSSKSLLLILLGGVALLLFAACGNVTNLALTRALARRPELALRTVLGAGPGRLAGEMISECLLLSLAGAAFGLGFASLFLRALRPLIPPQIPRVDSIQLDLPVLACTIALSLAVGLLVGLFPALAILRRQPFDPLREAAGAVGSRSTHRLRGALIVSEIAVGVILLVGCGLLLRTLWNLARIDPGFRTKNLVLGQITLPRNRFPELHLMTAFVMDLEERLNARPEITAAGVVSTPPLLAWSENPLSIDGLPAPDAQMLHVLTNSFSPRSFEALGIPLVAGRLIEATDTATTLPVVLVNQLFVTRYLGNHEPLGQHLRLAAGTDPQPGSRTIVGIVGDVRSKALDLPPQPAIYLPIAQRPAAIVTVVARPSGPPAAALQAIRSSVTEVHPDQIASRLRTLDEDLERQLSARTFIATLTGAFSVIALILIIAGLYAVVTLAATQRRKEIAIRLALGASSASISGMILRWGGLLVGLGLVLGLAGSLAASQTLSSLLYGVEPIDLATVAGALLIIAVLGIAAILLPALRAAGLEPAALLTLHT